ncbi:MAG: 1-deoxy-D-xylulose-5-phosphate synthase [Proteobacteria bacterium]|nr:1-deoxy-D-xylulose-5-phosphate synthase [Pseudomonadota bacterium]
MTETTISLADVKSPADLKDLTLAQLAELAARIRRRIIDTVSRTGGHLAPSLGVVELTLALHKVFDAPVDKIVWDVGHQTYCHKLITGREPQFDTLRQLDGLSGFPRRRESLYDTFDTGHSSTSISAALGMAVAKRLKGEPGKVIAVIGDGSLTGGLAYEGLNQAGDRDEDLIVVLNDNKMSISENVGALSSILSRQLSSRFYQRLRKEVEKFLKSIPGIGESVLALARKSEESWKSFVTPGMLFEAFKFNYLGPIDGHRLDRLISTFENVRELSGPILVHVVTQKGKGFAPAEANPAHYHGVGKFDVNSGAPHQKGHQAPSYTQVFGQTMCRLAEVNDRVFAITAAMPEGTGLIEFSEKFPDRFMDVGIAEQHAVVVAAGLAVEGLRPVVAIYSTFLQRAFDQIVHDVCHQDLPVVFALDRGGIVGQDGSTHQGLFDLCYLRPLPHMIVAAPKDEEELRRLLFTGLNQDHPFALRYPRGRGLGVELSEDLVGLPVGRGEILRDGHDVALLAVGAMVAPAVAAAAQLARRGVSALVANARFIKPLDEDLITDAAARTGRVVTIEENVLDGGFGSAVVELLVDRGLGHISLKRLGIPDVFVPHGTQPELRAMYGLDEAGIVRAALKVVSGVQTPAFSQRAAR